MEVLDLVFPYSNTGLRHFLPLKSFM